MMMKKNHTFLKAIAAALAILPMPASALNYKVTPLVSNRPRIPAPNIDPNLVNSWGMFFLPNGSNNFWVADNNSNLSTLYKPDGTILPFVINVLSNPTGVRHNPTTTQFPITKGITTAPSSFVFVSESGTILGFNKAVDPVNAIVAVDNSASGEVYKGMDFGITCCQTPLLFAADFHNAKIDMFDGTFNRVGLITDPSLPAGYAPFNVRVINDLLYVSYAKQSPPLNHDDQRGPGKGFVSVYTLSGTLIKHLISHTNLDSPWGMALAPSNFGKFSGALLVGNFGDGRINAFDPDTGAILGQLKDGKDAAIIIDGLWSLEFDSNGTLYFTSGPNGEADGLVGTITPL